MPPVPAYSHELAKQKLEGAAKVLLSSLKEHGGVHYHGDHGKEHGFPKWVKSVQQYPPEPLEPEVFTLQVFRSNWFNEDRQGIHFETFMGPKEWKRKQIQIAMHIFHVERIPGTSLKRRAVAFPFVNEIYDLVSSWDGYTFRTGKYGAHPFTKQLPFDIETFEAQLSTELLRLCLELGPKMDKTLKSVLS